MQDTIQLAPGWKLTLGTKIEHSSYAGTEYMPNARLAWQIDPSELVWIAVSRAVRTPTHFDRGLVHPVTLEQAPDFASEKLTAWEMGWRGLLSDRTSLAVTAYRHVYDDLRVLMRTGRAGRFEFGNSLTGETVGAEAWGTYAATDRWRLSAGVTLSTSEFELGQDATVTNIDANLGNNPKYQFQLRSSMDIEKDVELDLGLRVVDHLPQPAVPPYIALDARLGWQVSDTAELWLAGFNLLDEHHPEAGTQAARGEIARSALLGGRLRF